MFCGRCQTMGSPENLAYLVCICLKASKQLNYINTHYCTVFQMSEPSSRMQLSAKGLHQTDSTLLKKSTNSMCSFSVILLEGIFHPLPCSQLHQANAIKRNSWVDLLTKQQGGTLCPSVAPHLQGSHLPQPPLG